MSSLTSSNDLISMIEKIDQHSIDMPPMTRLGYAVGVLGIAALQDSYTVTGFKDTICHYVATLRRALATADTNELAEKLRHRELLCGDILRAVIHLEQNAMGIDLNEGIVSDTNDAVDTDSEMSQADSAEWDLVSEMSDYL